MTDKTKKRASRIKLFSDSAAVRDQVHKALSALAHYIVETHELSGLLDGSASASGAELVILDVGDGTCLDSGEIHDARQRFSRIPLLVIADDLEQEHVRAIMHLDARDLLVEPLDNRKIVGAVELQFNAENVGSAQVVAVVSAVGGGGGSSLATSMAHMLAAGDETPHGTCLVDLDFSSASAGYYLGAVSDYDLATVIDQPTRIDSEFLDIIRKETDAGFSVFSFDQKDLPLHPKAADLVLRMLDVLSFQYRRVVVDVPYWEAGWKIPALQAVNEIFIVSTFTIPALKQARDLYKRLAEARGSRDGITIIINRYKRRLFSNTLSKSELKKVFKDRPVAFIREDHETLTEAVNRGVLPSEVNSRSRFVKDAHDVLADHRKRNDDAEAA
jgi:pilus assembly protein CpaE